MSDDMRREEKRKEWEEEEAQRVALDEGPIHYENVRFGGTAVLSKASEEFLLKFSVSVKNELMTWVFSLIDAVHLLPTINAPEV